MKRLSRQHQRIAIVALLGLALIIGFILWAFSSNEARISNGTATKQVIVKLEPKQLNDPYFTFTYPGIYRIDSDKPQGVELSNYFFTANTSVEKRMTVMLTEAEMTNLSAYTFRQTRPDLYSVNKIQKDTETITIWTKLDGSEVTAFLPRNGRVATISVSVQNTNVTEGLPQEMTAILDSFRWQ